MTPLTRRVRDAVAVARDGVAATVGTGLLRPISPPRAVRGWRAVSRFGLTLATAAELAAIRWPERAAILDERGCLTYAELNTAATAISNGLFHAGALRQGDRLGILCRNHRDFVLTAVAGSRLGADLVFLSTDLGAAALAGVLEREAVTTVVLDQEFGPALEHSGFTGRRVSGAALSELMTSVAPPAPLPADRGRLVVLTSGTTGVPKGAPRDVARLRMGLPVTSLLASLRLRSGEPMAIQPPLFHGFGLGFLAAALTLGCPAILRRRFGQHDALDLVQQHSATVLAGVPVCCTG